MVPHCRSDRSTQGTDEGNVTMAAKFLWYYIIFMYFIVYHTSSKFQGVQIFVDFVFAYESDP